MLTIEKIIEKLSLIPLVKEGGLYHQTYRSSLHIDKNFLPEIYSGKRSISTAIYYFLASETFSAMHKLPSDEIYHFYLGDPVEMLQLKPDGSGEIITIGNRIEEDMLPQVVLKANSWQGSKLIDDGEFALLGTTVSPGFEFDDYVHGDRGLLIKEYPEFREMIVELTKEE